MSLRKLGQGVVFLAGAVVGGLALAFLVVYFRPELLVRTRNVTAFAPVMATSPATGTAPAAAMPEPVLPATSLHSFAATVRRAGPAVVNIYTARVVTVHHICMRRHP